MKKKRITTKAQHGTINALIPILDSVNDTLTEYFREKPYRPFMESSEVDESQIIRYSMENGTRIQSRHLALFINHNEYQEGEAGLAASMAMERFARRKKLEG